MMTSKECEEQLKRLIYDWETEGLLTKINATDIEAIKHLMIENQIQHKEISRLKQPTIFIDTQDMEERYAEGLYMDYLKEENQKLKDRDLIIAAELTKLQDENKQLKEELVSANESITWWNNRFNVVTRDNEQLKNKIKELVKYGYGTDMSLGEFKEFYKLGTGKDYDPKKCPEVK